MIKKDYSKLEKDDLLKVIEKLESRKKYGLIWDEEKVKEQFEKDAENALPVLKEVKSKEIIDKNSGPLNIFIEGDNYHALSVLNFTHQGKVDVIYIDPPYNTGSKDWKYNNDYVDKNDSYIHSKWLSFMSKRLQLAKNLLKETGVFICTIDENEHATLGMLLDEIFPDREIVCVTIVHNPGGIQGKNFSYCHEYAYFVYPKGGTYISNIKRDDIAPTPLRDWGKENSKRQGAKNCFYPIFVKKGTIVGFGNVCPDNFHPKGANVENKDGIIEVYPIDKNGVERKWRFSRQSIESIKDELISQEIKGGMVILRDKRDYRWKTVWTDAKYNANVYGTQMVNKLVKTTFPFPKSFYAVKDCIKACIHPKDAIILDFFAGSGTTGHAVLELNKEEKNELKQKLSDGKITEKECGEQINQVGNRKFILCTNNENNIAEDVCYPRIKKVIEGHKDFPDITGIPSNLKYFKTKFVKDASNKDDFKIRITKECTEMLCLREGIFDEMKKTDDYRVFQQGDKTLAVYYSLDRKALSELKKELNKIDGDKIFYCFTLDPLGVDKSDFISWNNVSLEPIPQKILDVYKQIYEY